MKKILAMMSMVALLLFTVGLAACTPAELQALQGTLKNVDTVSGTVTVTLNDGTTQTFNFKDVEVGTVAEALGNAKIEVGDEVTVKVRQNGDVEQVKVKYAEVHGVIKEAGADSLTVTTKKQGDVTLNITAETKIRMGDRTTVLADLKPGQQAETKYDVVTKNALRINVAASGDKKAEVEGVVKAVDAANKTVTIISEMPGEIVLKVTEDTALKIEGKRTAAFSDLAVGQKVEVKYDPTTLTALKLEIEEDDEVED